MGRIFTGRNLQVGIALEEERGKGESAAEYTYPFMEYSLRDVDATTAYREDSYGTNIKNSGKDTLLIEGDGSIKGNIYAKGIVYMLALAFGKLPTTTDVTGDTDAKKHSFELKDDNEHATATVFLDEPNIGQARFPGLMPDEITFNWAPGEYPTVEMSVKAGKSKSSSHTLTVVDEAMFLPDTAYFKIASDAAGLDESEDACDIKSFSLTIKKNLEPQQTMCSGNSYQEIFNKDFEVTGEINKLYRDTTYRSKALDDTVNAIEFGFIDSKNLAGTDTPNSIKFVIPEAAFNGYEPTYGLSDISEEKIEFAMIRKPTSSVSEAFTAEVVNKYEYTTD